nr:uncharacterized protein LOC127314512 [Lolium perenne]
MRRRRRPFSPDHQVRVHAATKKSPNPNPRSKSLVAAMADQGSEQAIGGANVAAAAPQKVAPGTGLSDSELGKHVDAKAEADKTMGEEEKAVPETEGTAPDDPTVEEEDDDTEHYYTTDEELKWSEDESDDDDVEFQVVVDRVTAKYNRYMQKLLARDTSVVFTDITFDSEGEAVYA